MLGIIFGNWLPREVKKEIVSALVGPLVFWTQEKPIFLVRNKLIKFVVIYVMCVQLHWMRWCSKLGCVTSIGMNLI